MEKLSLKNIYMNYHSLKNETKTLDNISFKIDEGEFTSIVGPSGCGKSTLLNIIAALLKPSSGEIKLDGKIINSFSPKIGYMFQKDHLFEWLTIEENASIGLKIQKKFTKENIEKVQLLLKNYNLDSFKDYHPNELSGGMRQKAALIRTLALNPEILLLDEPFSALDYQTRLNAGDEIYKIIRKEKKTAIMVTHDISEAVSMSDRVIVLSKRPAKVKEIFKMDFSDEFDTPLKRRESEKFRVYFNEIWKELDVNGQSKL